MKVLILILGFISTVFSAPRIDKPFYEHTEDFLELIIEESGHNLELLLKQYVKYQEFMQSLEYLQTNNFMDIVRETEMLPEFKAMVHFLEKDNIDITYFVDMLNQLLGFFDKRDVHLQVSGRNMTSYMKDSISLFPKENLSTLFEHKMVKHKEFRATMEKLRSPEWRHILNALWSNRTFKAHRQTLIENGIDISILIKEIKAIFGQD